MKVSVLASGSKGNATLVKCGDAAILIDMGISVRRLSKELSNLGMVIDDIDAIFITHSHTDHFNGLDGFLKKRKVPFFASEETASSIEFSMKDQFEKCGIEREWMLLSPGETFYYKKMSITPFEVPHDANGAMAYTIEGEGVKFGIATDLGFVPNSVKNRLKCCDALVFEMNHDIGMLESSDRPQILKSRISGKLGHLSNDQAVEFLEDIGCSSIKYFFPAHLSEECNDFSCVMAAICGSEKCRGLKVVRTSQNEATPLVDIGCK